MKLGLLLQRSTDLKWAGPFAQEALAQKHEVSLFALDRQDDDPGKQYLKISMGQCTDLMQSGATYISLDELDISEHQELMSQDAAFILEGFHTQQANQEAWQYVRAAGVKLYSLSHFFEICKRPLAALDKFDGSIYISQYAQILHKKLQGTHSSGHTAVLGSPMFDQLRNVSRAAARRELGISLEERVVLLIAPVILPTTPWRFHVWRDGSRIQRLKDAIRASEFRFIWEIAFGNTFKQVFEAIAAFSERNNARLIIKSRGKQRNLEFIAEKNGVFVDGLSDEYYPLFSTYKLMSAADLCITVNSMAVLEAAALGCPCINIQVPFHDRAAASTPEKEAYNRELMGGHKESIMNYEGAVRSVDRLRAIDYFGKDWEHVSFEPSTGAEYAQKFLGIRDQSASKRLLEHVVEAG
jgi:hypothetical protein